MNKWISALAFRGLLFCLGLFLITGTSRAVVGPGAGNNFGGRRILVLGIDGCRRDVVQALIAAGRAPNLKSIAQNGTSYWGVEAGGGYHQPTQQPTITGPGWSSVCTGVFENKHGIHDNDTDKKNDSHYEDYPHFYRHIREYFPDAWLASICDAVTPNSVLQYSGDGLGNLVYTPTSTQKNDGVADDAVTTRVIQCLDENDPDAIFVHFLDADHAGHTYGYGNQFPEYVDTVAKIDARIGRILTALHNRPQYAQEKWLIAVTADHGGNAGKTHGSQSADDRQIFGLFQGEGFTPGLTINALNYQSIFVPTFLRYLGIAINPDWGLEGSPAQAVYPPAHNIVSMSEIRRNLEYPGSHDGVIISANITSIDPITSAVVRYEVGGSPGLWTEVPMVHASGMRYEANLGTFPDQTLVKYRVVATNGEFTTDMPFPLARLPFFVFDVDDHPVTESDIVINEILYDPSGADNADHSEYVELCNRRSTPVDMSFFTFSDTVGTPDDYMFPEGTVIPANGYLVLAGNKAAFDHDTFRLSPDPSAVILDINKISGLNQDMDSPNIVHANAVNWDYKRSVPMDFVPYGTTAPWPLHGAGRPIELVSPAADNANGANWRLETAGTSGSYGTPGNPNTIWAPTTDPRMGLVGARRNIEYPGSGDSIIVSAIITGDKKVAQVKIHVTAGTQTSETVMTNTEGEKWNVSIGPYTDGTLVKYYFTADIIGTVEATLPSDGVTNPFMFRVDDHPAMPGDLVINELMYGPAGTDNHTRSEWFEIYNTTPYSQDVGDFRFQSRMDSPDKYLIPEGTIIPPHGYLVIAGVGSHFQNDYPSFLSSGGLLVDAGWVEGSSTMTNGNSGLIDVKLTHLNALGWSTLPNQGIDEVKYQYNNWPWPGETEGAKTNNGGYSVELVHWGLDNNNGGNWRVSEVQYGTPGAQNSAYEPPPSGVADWSMY